VALLYNLWIVLRNAVGNMTSHKFKRILGILLNALLPVVFCDDTGPPR